MLRMHTAGTAWQLRQEKLTGTVEAGKSADLVLLDRDVTRCPVADISGTGVRMTLVGGRVVTTRTRRRGGRLRAGWPARRPARARPRTARCTGAGTARAGAGGH
ncbi:MULTISPECIES: amidohydrolase family protein [unclassified Streptomyces]|uniref:amidohydrolase family protein n=1 Tax=unclassified Streptomyces TaxID=2593676 RepID=UPI0027E539D9|nr:MULTISPECIES: amidohydrolase family protein [unclassified Streptomyces]